MKYKVFPCLLVIVLFSLIACQPEEPQYVFSIEGKVPNLYPGQVLLTQATDINQKEFEVIDTLSIAPDSSFQASYNLEPHYYVLNFYDSLKVPFIADSGQQIKIEFPTDGRAIVSGSPDTERFEQYEKFRNDILKQTVYPLRGQLYSMLGQNDPNLGPQIGELGQRLEAAEAKYRDTLIHAVKKMGPSIAVYPTTVRWNGDKDMAYYDQLASELSQKYDGLKVAEEINEKVRVLKQVSIGGKVSDIVAQDSTGTELTLYSNLGKYTLIDFWGSWCAPCRAESQSLNEMYSQYHDAGFEIFGFGVETRKDKWAQAIQKDNRNWINVSTLDGYKNEVSKEYSITSLPKNFLVDENGIIIGKDLHGEELAAKLAELFSGI
ncbi:TlpA disulfide reductase family protein [Reichenbachiella ulvae]|uniref:AhpC/TSA family protein n=1 Tax=Reichenbachiella ulvae TaxID=2980104 RepID=A0ABT3CTV9_9BACT|nr:TlpA disulfide reductase family protein [Reichenbachiella ulvae]MCV9387141.1 AhpC/TSA family protein [Reichenbachiella ulvae]